MSNQVLEEDRKIKQHLTNGVKLGIPISIGYIPIAITFGVLAKSLGIPDYIILMMSFLIFAGASQFIGVNLIIAGVSHWEILITTLILNFRHFLLTASLSQHIPDWVSKKLLATLSFGVTDETFSVASTSNQNELHPYTLLGLNMIAFTSWNIGTSIGVFLAVGLPEIVQESMGIALYSMFIGLLLPSLSKSKPVIIVVIITVLISSILHWVLPYFILISSGWNIIIATVVSATIGVFLFPNVGDENE